MCRGFVADNVSVLNSELVFAVPVIFFFVLSTYIRICIIYWAINGMDVP